MRFYKEYANNTKFIEISTNARRSWLDLKVFHRSHKSNSTHIVWGRLSIRFGGFDCLTCHDTNEAPNGDFCYHCCEHGEYDHGICYNCGKDCTDDLVGAAEAYYEGDR